MSGNSAVVTVLLVVLGVALANLVSFRMRRWTIFEGQRGLLYRAGRFERELPPGRHRLFDLRNELTLTMVPAVPVTLAQPLLTVISKDQFSFRLTVHVTARITDGRAYEAALRAGRSQPLLVPFASTLTSPDLWPALADALLAHVGERTLEDFIADPRADLDALTTRVMAPGIVLDAIRITEIQVPPEVRKMFTEVERARREGLAQLERARGEQASLRALANAARALQDNPRLAELRMWQLMEGAKGNKTFVIGKSAEIGSDGSATRT